MKKKIISLLLALTLCLCLALTVSAEETYYYVYDEAYLLTADEEAALAEKLADFLLGTTLHILHTVMKEARRNGGCVQHEIRQDDRHRTGVAKIGITGFTHLICMCLFCIVICTAHHIHVVARVIFAAARDQFFYTHIYTGVAGLTHPQFLLSDLKDSYPLNLYLTSSANAELYAIPRLIQDRLFSFHFFELQWGQLQDPGLSVPYR